MNPSDADPAIAIRPAVAADLPRLHLVVERAYRGPTARQGWSHEADLLEGARTDLPTLEALVASPRDVLLMAERDGAPLGCVQVSDRGEGLAWLGLLCVEPTLQAAGLGRRLIAAAEAWAAERFAADRIEMGVISLRRTLIDYYCRRGYRLTGEERAFPIPLDPPLALAVLEKALVA